MRNNQLYDEMLQEMDQATGDRKALNSAVVDVLFKYIDRMNDVCDDYDHAKYIIEEFVADVQPLLDEIMENL